MSAPVVSGTCLVCGQSDAETSRRPSQRHRAQTGGHRCPDGFVCTLPITCPLCQGLRQTHRTMRHLLRMRARGTARQLRPPTQIRDFVDTLLALAQESHRPCACAAPGPHQPDCHIGMLLEVLDTEAPGWRMWTSLFDRPEPSEISPQSHPEGPTEK